MNFISHLTSKKRALLLLTAAVLLAAGIVVICLLNKPHAQSSFSMDDRAETSVDMNDPEAVQKKVQETADASRMNLRINSAIALKKNGDKALLYLRNVPENRYDLYVELISDESGKTVYQSKTLKPGENIEKDKLSGIEKTGEQPYTALFHVLEDGKEISTIEYAITITLDAE